MKKLNGETYKIAPHLLTKVANRKRHKKEGWRKIWLYRKHKKFDVAKKMMNEEIIIDNVTEVRDDVLYKDNKKSKADKVWDWYKILKPEIVGDALCEKDDRGSKAGVKVKKLICPMTHKYIKDVKPIILNFD